MGCGIERININSGRVTGMTLSSGETITADVVFSSAGYYETMGLCSDTDTDPPPDRLGRVSFVEWIAVLDERETGVGRAPAGCAATPPGRT